MGVFWTLGIETATAAGGVALMRDGAVAGERSFEGGMVHGRDVAPAIEALLREHAVLPEALGLVAVDVGPGSHTGVRVGLAAARGLGFGAGCPVIGVASLEAMTADAEGPVVAVIDGRRRRVFARLPEGMVSVTPEALIQRLPAGATVVLDGAGPIAGRLGDRRVETNRPPRAATVARLGRERFERQGAGNPGDLVPLYLAPS